jgi:hypothetical protein
MAGMSTPVASPVIIVRGHSLRPSQAPIRNLSGAVPQQQVCDIRWKIT